MSIKEVLLQIADDLDEHIDRGQPYGLTFFGCRGSGHKFKDNDTMITSEQKEALEEYLAYEFHDIWGRTWIKGEAEKLRTLAEAIKETHIKLTVVDNEKLEEAGYPLRRIVDEVKDRLDMKVG